MMDLKTTKCAIERLRVLNNEQCQRIIECLERPMSVGELTDRTGMEQSCTSFYVAKLQSIGVVKSERRGKQRIKSLDYERLAWYAERARLLAF